MVQSVARQFYEQFASEGVDNDTGVRLVRQLIGTKFEDDTFDAKQEPGGKDENDRKQKLREMWSEILCGFANAAGGVIIWGLVAKSDPVAKKNKVRREHLVQDPARLEAELRRLQGELTDPPLGNVEHRALDTGTGGFVVSFIPEGPLKPYRQRHETGNYYYRWSDTFRVMPRHMLQAMFYPRARAAFSAHGVLSWQPFNTENSKALVELVVLIGNGGPGTGNEVVINVQKQYLQVDHGTASDGWRESGGFFFRGSPLHPGMSQVEVFKYQWVAPTTQDSPGVFEFRPNISRPPTLVIAVFAENQEPQRFLMQPPYLAMRKIGRSRSESFDGIAIVEDPTGVPLA